MKFFRGTLTALACALLTIGCTSTEVELPTIENTPLQQAARDGEADKVLQLLAEGAGVNEGSGEEGYLSPLWLALNYGDGDMEIVEALLKAGAEVGEVEVRAAAQSCYPQYLRAVLDAGGRIPKYSRTHGSIFSELMYKTGNTNGRDSVACAKLLEERGASLSPDDAPTTPLHSAVLGDNLPLVSYLLTRGIPVNARNEDGNTPLNYGVESEEMVELLVSAGADVNAQNNQGDTPLMEHIFITEESAKALLEAGANPNICNNKGENALLHHLYNPQPTGGAFFDDDGNIIGTWSGYEPDKGILSELIEAGADIHAADKTGTTPADLMKKDADLAKLLPAAQN